MIDGEPCELLSWDSDHFGVRVARLRSPAPDAEALVGAERWCDERSVDCLYLLVSASDRRALDLPNPPFRPVDVRLTLEWRRQASAPAPPSAPRAATRLRPASGDDLPALRRIARTSHTDSRFYFDPGFPDSRCDHLYERWIERSVRGVGEVWVVEDGGIAAGYLTCQVDPDGVGRIGLLGVAEEARGRGCGGELVAAALASFAAHGVERVRVVTQGRNVSAQRLYQRHGFVTVEAGLWFHRWFDRRRDAR